MPTITLNCDLGEGLDTIDAEAMPYIDCANIACGGHAGDTQTMSQTIKLALAYNVDMGAHPSYPDREHFGRKSLQMSPNELQLSLHQQVQCLADIAKQQGAQLTYIKPHGALYNDCHNPQVLASVLEVARGFKLPVMLMASNAAVAAQCHAAGVVYIHEAFADRRYENMHQLVNRRQTNALLDETSCLLQAKQLITQQGLFSCSNQWLPIHCQSLCVHSDTANATSRIKALATLLKKT